MVRVVGTDPGNAQPRPAPAGRRRRRRPGAGSPPRRSATTPRPWSRSSRGWAPIDLVAGPSGYGLPLVRGGRLTEDAPRPDVAGPARRAGLGVGVIGFRSWVRALRRLGLPGRLPPRRDPPADDPRPPQAQRDRPGHADKVAVAALALWFDRREQAARPRPMRPSRSSSSARPSRRSWSSSAGGSSTPRPGPAGRSASARGAPGTARSPTGDRRSRRTTSSAAACDDLGPVGPDAFRESLIKHVAGLQAVTPFDRIYLSGAAAERPEIAGLADRGPRPVRHARPAALACPAPGSSTPPRARPSSPTAWPAAGLATSSTADALRA